MFLFIGGITLSLSPCCLITKELSIGYVSAIEKCIKEIDSNSDSTMLFAANLRFLLETCITVRLLANDISYKYKVKYSIYIRQIEISKSLAEYAHIDIQLLDELEERTASLIEEYQNSEKILELPKEFHNLYDELDKKISIFLDAAPINGASYHKNFIKKYIKSLEERESEISAEWIKVKKSLINDDNIRANFDFKKQESRVEKELTDSRSWKKKAESVNLSEMYNIIYNYTSLLMHSTSYSILLPNQLDKSETLMIVSLSTRLVADILKNLREFASIPNMKVININE